MRQGDLNVMESKGFFNYLKWVCGVFSSHESPGSCERLVGQLQAQAALA